MKGLEKYLIIESALSLSLYLLLFLNCLKSEYLSNYKMLMIGLRVIGLQVIFLFLSYLPVFSKFSMMYMNFTDKIAILLKSIFIS